jgi:hypothetical protein
LVVREKTSPVFTSVTVTVAPGMIAPDASVTVPEILP